MTTLASILRLASGQCVWIGRPDIHVYCHAPAGRDARYSVICPDAGRDDHHWTTAAEAAATIDAILAQEQRHVA